MLRIRHGFHQARSFLNGCLSIAAGLIPILDHGPKDVKLSVRLHFPTEALLKARKPHELGEAVSVGTVRSILVRKVELTRLLGNCSFERAFDCIASQVVSASRMTAPE